MKPKGSNMTVQLILIIITIGMVAGMLSGLVGIGGGIVLVPAVIYFLNYSQHQAQGTSLGVLVFPVVLVAFLKYYKECKAIGQPIEWKIVLLLAAGFVVGGYFGSALAMKINQALLKKIFAVILLYTAFKMLGVDQWLFRNIRGIFS